MGRAGVGQDTGHPDDNGDDQKDEADHNEHEAPPTRTAAR
jgi:hypothetical protein